MNPLGNPQTPGGFLELHAPDTEFGCGQEDDYIRVLHVDDEPAFGDLVTAFLTREDTAFSVTTESSAETALDRLETEQFDCIVSDYQMPVVDGIEFLGRVRERHPDLPFILFTGRGSEEVAGAAIDAGVTGYLQKMECREQYALLANRIEHAVARYRAEKNADRSLRALEHAGEGIAFLDGDGSFLYVNDEFASLYGYDRGELLGEDFSKLTRTEDSPESLLALVDKANPDRWHGPAVHQRADGSSMPVELTITYSPPDRSYVCTVHEQSDAEALRAELSLKEMAMDAAPIGIIITDSKQADEPIVYANGGFSRLTGYEERDVLGRNCRFLQGVETDETEVSRLRAAIDAREMTTVDLLNYKCDGTTFWNRVSIAPIRIDGQVTHFVGFQQDITELTESKLAQARTED